MIEIKGNACKDVMIFTDNVETEAMSLIYSIANHPTFANTKIRIMPDVHAGKGITIGFTAPLNDYVNPSHVGCDIGCSMTTILFDTRLDPADYKEVEHKIRKEVPTGFDIHDKRMFGMDGFTKFMNTEMRKARSAWPEMVDYSNIDEKYIDSMLKRVGMDPGVFYKSIGTVGGGNHFVEYGEYEGGSAWTIHCGSRNFGLKVFKYWDNISKKAPYTKNELRDLTNKFKEEYKKSHSDMREFPTALDKYIDETSCKLEQLKGHKNGLMQQLFPRL